MFRKRSEPHKHLGVTSLLVIKVIVAEYNYITSYYIKMHLYTHTHI